ncbi:MAG: DUF711 family protein [Anaerolineales bacterium]|jgi:uncharacterized protein (UPF0210 family)
MKIRSITYFCNPGWPVDESEIEQAGKILAEAKVAYEAAGYEVQSTRLATVPFLQILGADKISETPRLAEQVAAAIQFVGIAYAALGPAQPEVPDSFAVIPEAIAATQNIFFSGTMADASFGISLPAVQACAGVIARCGTIAPDGFANLRFAALANVRPGSPFFPAAYHGQDKPMFAIATEAADLAVEVFTHVRTVTDGQWMLSSAIEKHARELALVGDMLSRRFSITFGGIDFSLAPFPSETASIGAALERMGAPKAGLHGSLAAAAILTEIVERVQFPRVGFSGLMLPVLEDSVLARRAAEGTLTVKDLLLYSAVCGTGLDTVPLPGDTTVDQIAALLLDLSALALRLNKSLTARLMPIPGKKAGDPTNFNFDYFANSRVMALEAQALRSPLSETRQFPLAARHR